VVLLALLEISGHLSRFYLRPTVGLVKVELLSSICMALSNSLSLHICLLWVISMIRGRIEFAFVPK
jgi:hypothetical protein